MSAHRITVKTLFAIFVATFAALIAREVARMQLVGSGYPSDFSADLSYFAVPIVLLIVLFPVWPSEKGYLAAQFSIATLSWKMVLRAIAIGLLLRVIWWCKLIAGVSFGIYYDHDATTTLAPIFSFDCPELTVFVTGLFVMAVLVPVIEEIIHRSYFLGGIRWSGAIASVTISAIVFMLFHKHDGWLFVFFGGVVFGTQYWHTKTIWASVISHATVNGLIQFDWRCLTTRWNPPASEIPLMLSGTIALILLFACLLLLIILLRQMAIGAHHALR